MNLFNITKMFYPEDPGSESSVDELLDELTGGNETPTEDPQVEDPQVEDPQVEDPQVEDPEEEKESGIKGLRKSYEEEKKRAKALEEEKAKLEADSQSKTDKLLKAIRLGIKGETEEEILSNLEDYEIKEKAERAGLTEEQIKKDQELSEKMEKLTSEQQELLFNKRAFNMQQELSLTEEQVMEFVKEAGNLGINLLTTSADFTNIYNRLYSFDTQSVISEKDEEIKNLKSEIAELKKGRAPRETPKGDPDSGEVDELLARLTGE